MSIFIFFIGIIFVLSAIYCSNIIAAIIGFILIGISTIYKFDYKKW